MGIKNRISLMIGNRMVYLEGEKSETFLNRVQSYYNTLIDRIVSETDYSRLDDDLKSALVSFNIIDELITTKDALQAAISDIKNKEKDYYSLNHDMGTLQLKYETLQKQYDELEKRLNYQKIKVESSLVTNAMPDRQYNFQQNNNSNATIPSQNNMHTNQFENKQDQFQNNANQSSIQKTDEFMASINKTFGMNPNVQKAAIEKQMQNLQRTYSNQNGQVTNQNVNQNINSNMNQNQNTNQNMNQNIQRQVNANVNNSQTQNIQKSNQINQNNINQMNNTQRKLPPNYNSALKPL